MSLKARVASLERSKEAEKVVRFVWRYDDETEEQAMLRAGVTDKTDFVWIGWIAGNTPLDGPIEEEGALFPELKPETIAERARWIKQKSVLSETSQNQTEIEEKPDKPIGESIGEQIGQVVKELEDEGFSLEDIAEKVSGESDGALLQSGGQLMQLLSGGKGGRKFNINEA